MEFTNDYLNQVIQGDCLEVMGGIPDKSVDLVLTDPPYGCTHNEWDNRVNTSSLFSELWRIAKTNAPIIMTSREPFTSELILNQGKLFRYDLIWFKKGKATGFLNANKMPLRSHENILVFYQQLPIFHPQKTIGETNHSKGSHSRGKKQTNNNYGEFDQTFQGPPTTDKFPISVLEFNAVHPPIHPTQKPVELMQYLIKTYSDDGATILDPFFGSGTTGVAAKLLGRQFIGIEISEKYCEIARKRIDATLVNKKLEFK
jgi:DNA modification methylase